MKLRETADDKFIQSGDQSDTYDYSLKVTAKSFRILSSSLYRDKILAVIRELSCNAYDSHVAAGKKDIPFDIHLPTILKPEFVVRDYGVGLSSEDMEIVYVKYFESTKNESNDEIGALGLGSKSPFAYVSSYTVTTWHDGRRMCYTAFFSPDGLPRLKKIYDVPNDDPEETGVEVRMGARESDFYMFKSRSQQALEFFYPKPNVYESGNQLDFFSEPEIVQETDSFVFCNSTQPEALYAQMGGVLYPIEPSQIRYRNLPAESNNALQDSIRKFVSSFISDKRQVNNIADTLVLKFGIGDLDFAASREELSYDDVTVGHLCSKIFNFIVNEIGEQLKNKFVGLETKTDAFRVIHENKAYIRLYLDTISRLRNTGVLDILMEHVEFEFSDPIDMGFDDKYVYWNGQRLSIDWEFDTRKIYFATDNNTKRWNRKSKEEQENSRKPRMKFDYTPWCPALIQYSPFRKNGKIINFLSKISVAEYINPNISRMKIVFIDSSYRKRIKLKHNFGGTDHDILVIDPNIMIHWRWWLFKTGIDRDMLVNISSLEDPPKNAIPKRAKVEKNEIRGYYPRDIEAHTLPVQSTIDLSEMESEGAKYLVLANRSVKYPRTAKGLYVERDNISDILDCPVYGVSAQFVERMESSSCEDARDALDRLIVDLLADETFISAMTGYEAMQSVYTLRTTGLINSTGLFRSDYQTPEETRRAFVFFDLISDKTDFNPGEDIARWLEENDKQMSYFSRLAMFLRSCINFSLWSTKGKYFFGIENYKERAAKMEEFAEQTVLPIFKIYRGKISYISFSNVPRELNRDEIKRILATSLEMSDQVTNQET